MTSRSGDEGSAGGAPLGGRRSRRLPLALAGATFLVVMAATLIAALNASHQVDRNERLELERRVDTTLRAVDRRMSNYVEVLYGTRGLFVASDDVTRAEFHEYAMSLDLPKRYPGIQVLGFAGRVAAGDRAAYEQDVRADAAASGLPYPRFAVYGSGPNPTDEHFVIDRIEPQTGNEQAFGLDFLSEPNRRDAVRRAVDSGAPAATAPITLVQETATQAGFLVDLPLYEAGEAPPEVAARRRGARGVVYAAFRMGDLMEGVLGTETTGFDLEIYDVGPVGAGIGGRAEAQLAYDRDGTPDALGDASPGGLVRPLDVGGRTWAVYYRPTEDLSAVTESDLPLIILVGGTVLAVLAAALVGALSDGRRRAQLRAEAMTEDLRASREELRRSNAELEQFAYVASHDLREPLRTVANFVGLLKRRYGPGLDEKANQYMDFAVDGASRMSGLIDDLLTYSRVGPGTRETEPTSLDDAWDTAVGNLSANIAETGASVRRGDLPMIEGDPGSMVQVFQNLISNALKYRSDASPRVTADAERVNGDWRIAVSDNGIGIDPSHREVIFQMYQRLHTSGEYEGTGMGLAIARKSLTSIGGDLVVADGDGPGSTFVITLPAGDGAER